VQPGQCHVLPIILSFQYLSELDTTVEKDVGLPVIGAAGLRVVNDAQHPARPSAQHDNAATEENRLLDCVGDEDHGDVFLEPDFLHKVLQTFPGKGVEGRQGLIHKEDLRLNRQSPGHSNPLLHAAGQLAGIVGTKTGQPHFHQQQLDLLDLLGFEALLGKHPVGNVFDNRRIGDGNLHALQVAHRLQAGAGSGEDGENTLGRFLGRHEPERERQSG